MNEPNPPDIKKPDARTYGFADAITCSRSLARLLFDNVAERLGSQGAAGDYALQRDVETAQLCLAFAQELMKRFTGTIGEQAGKQRPA